jgi:hypothetical protein
MTWWVYLGLVYGLGLSLRKALKGGANLYVGNEDAWDTFFWNWVAFGMLACLVAGMAWLLAQARRRRLPVEVSRNPAAVIWLVLIAQNVLAQVVTGPLWGPRASWNEFAFSILYIVLFCLTAAIVFHMSMAAKCARSSAQLLPPGGPAPSHPGSRCP